MTDMQIKMLRAKSARSQQRSSERPA